MQTIKVSALVLLVCQLVRDELCQRVAALHLGVDFRFHGPVQHQGHDEGGRQRPPGRHPSVAGLRLSHHAQPGHQGGKSCGVYLSNSTS